MQTFFFFSFSFLPLTFVSCEISRRISLGTRLKLALTWIVLSRDLSRIPWLASRPLGEALPPENREADVSDSELKQAAE